MRPGRGERTTTQSERIVASSTLWVTKSTVLGAGGYPCFIGADLQPQVGQTITVGTFIGAINGKVFLGHHNFLTAILKFLRDLNRTGEGFGQLNTGAAGRIKGCANRPSGLIGKG